MLLIRWTRSVAGQVPSDATWRQLLSDMVKVHELALPAIGTSAVHDIFGAVLLSHGDFKLAHEMVTVRSGGAGAGVTGGARVPALQLTSPHKLVLEASREYFDNAASADRTDDMIAKAKEW